MTIVLSWATAEAASKLELLLNKLVSKAVAKLNPFYKPALPPGLMLVKLIELAAIRELYSIFNEALLPSIHSWVVSRNLWLILLSNI
jgi:hypothetical protein